MDRIKKLCSYLDKCTVFADVGCDHGYCTRFMLKNGLCERAIISDISEKCLNKAESLLSAYISSGKVKSVCCSGLEKIEGADAVLIAGMGGDEITEILKKSYIPENFVFQPMKNVRKVREFLLENGAEITLDEPFESSGKFYFVIKGKKNGKKIVYSEAQLEYGLNSASADSQKYLLSELNKKLLYLERPLNEQARTKIEKEVGILKEVLDYES